MDGDPKVARAELHRKLLITKLAERALTESSFSNVVHSLEEAQHPEGPSVRDRRLLRLEAVLRTHLAELRQRNGPSAARLSLSTTEKLGLIESRGVTVEVGGVTGKGLLGVVADEEMILAAEMALLSTKIHTGDLVHQIHGYLLACWSASSRGRRPRTGAPRHIDRLRNEWESLHGKLPRKAEAFHAIAACLGLVDKSLDPASLQRALRRARRALSLK